VSLAVSDGAWVISRAMACARAKRLGLEIVQDDAQIDLVEEGIDVAFRMGRLMDSALTRIARCKRLVLGTPAYFHRPARRLRRLNRASRPSSISRAKAAFGRFGATVRN
jgi:DNA-binding transcriptional LysR family regulator